MILNIDYKFRDDLKADTVPIELLTEKWKGIVYRYTVVKLVENETADALKMQFDYEILKNPTSWSDKSIKKNDQFKKHIGIILNEMLLLMNPTETSDEEIVEE